MKTENTGRNIVCPLCKKILIRYDGTEPLDSYNETYCNACNVAIDVEYWIDIQFSSYLKEVTNES